MDAFYASVEQRDHPELRGRPVLVGGTGLRGVVSAASYEARPFGVHSALPMATARRLCPQAVVLPVRMEHYAQSARQIRDIFLSFTPLVEPLSLDEAFLDVRGCEGLFGPAPQIARTIKESISTETTFPQDIGDRDVLRVWLLDLVDHLGGRVRQQGVRGRTVELKVRSSDFQTRTRSLSLSEATDVTEVIWQAALKLFERTVTREVLPVRLLGVGLTGLTDQAVTQGNLFEEARQQRQASLDRTIDTIRQQLGRGAIQRGSLLEHESIDW